MKRFLLAFLMILVSATAFADQGKKVVVVLATGFEEIEASAPIDIMRRAGLSVTVAGLDGTQVKGTSGLTYVADVTFSQVDMKDFDAIVLPGGLPGAVNLAGSDAVIAAVRLAAKDGKVVAAICASPALVLSKAGVLDGHRATCYPGFEKNFTASVSYETARVVTDGNLITANGPGSSLLFGVAIVDKMVGGDAARQLEQGLLVAK